MREGNARMRAYTIITLLASLAACTNEGLSAAEARQLTGGNPDAGRDAIVAYGCGACHTIPGVEGANSLVGPPLTGIGQRAFIAGVLANTPSNMIRWIQNPQAVDSLTAMPNMNVTPAQARDIAAYLYTIR
jgi:cytochrome c